MHQKYGVPNPLSYRSLEILRNPKLYIPLFRLTTNPRRLQWRKRIRHVPHRMAIPGILVPLFRLTTNPRRLQRRKRIRHVPHRMKDLEDQIPLFRLTTKPRRLQWQKRIRHVPHLKGKPSHLLVFNIPVSG